MSVVLLMLTLVVGGHLAIVGEGLVSGLFEYETR